METIDDPKDRRQHPRFEGQFQVDLLNMGDDPRVSPFEAVVMGEALDVSRTGMRLQVLYSVEVGTVLSVIVYYRRYESICLCKVMWRRDVAGQQLYGLYISEWSKLDPLLAKQLAAMEAREANTKHPSGPAAITSVISV